MRLSQLIAELRQVLLPKCPSGRHWSKTEKKCIVPKKFARAKQAFHALRPERFK